MRKPTRAILAAFALVLAFSQLSCGDSSLTIDNQSSYVIFEVNLAPVGTTTWGRNLLRGGTLQPGETVTADFIDCGTYDVRVIDDANRECILANLSLCFDDAAWVLTDSYLATCNW